MPERVEIVIEHEGRGTPRRSVTVEGEREAVAEVVGLYNLGKHCTVNKIKPKHFSKMVQSFCEELYGEDYKNTDDVPV